MGIVTIVPATQEGGRTRTLLLVEMKDRSDDAELAQILNQRCGIELEEYGFLPQALYKSTHLEDEDAQAVLLTDGGDNPMLTVCWAVIAPRPNRGFRIGWIQTPAAHQRKGHAEYLLKNLLEYLFRDRNAEKVTLEDASKGKAFELYSGCSPLSRSDALRPSCCKLTRFATLGQFFARDYNNLPVR